MKATFFGHSAWGVEAAGTRLLIDPYAVSSEMQAELLAFGGTCDFVLVTHGAYDHMGLAFDLLGGHDQVILVSEPGVARDALLRAIDPSRVVELVWNGEAVFDHLHIRAIETRHLSAFEGKDGVFLSGMPLGFIVWSAEEPDVRLLHLGDTSLFTDLAMLAQLYRPVVGLLGVGAARGFWAEMTPKEAAQAALWLGLDVAIPMHFEADEAAAVEFGAAIEHLPRPIQTWIPTLGGGFSFSRQTVFTTRI